MGAQSVTPKFEAWNFAGVPGRTLHVALFGDVANCKELQDRIKEGKLEPEVAMLNAEVVADLFVLRIAAQQALAQQHRGKLITKSLHAELVYNMSGSRHISESFKRFGVTESCKHLLVARFDAEPQQLQAITSMVAGQQRSLDGLSSVRDEGLIKKASAYYKVTPNELKIGTLADAALFKIAARDC
ncbi:MAG: hypothetical protein FRX49_01121 [Trebouxia sp. A1-2]|nr:MAG: hypothetical protein FRX49_01121 [Trebouxia sp. A1-2]